MPGTPGFPNSRIASSLVRGHSDVPIPENNQLTNCFGVPSGRTAGNVERESTDGVVKYPTSPAACSSSGGTAEPLHDMSAPTRTMTKVRCTPSVFIRSSLNDVIIRNINPKTSRVESKRRKVGVTTDGEALRSIHAGAG